AELRPQNRLECVEHRRVLDSRRHRVVAAIGKAPHVLAQDLARPGLGQRRDDVDELETRDGADVLPHRLDEFVGQPLGRRTPLEHDATAPHPTPDSSRAAVAPALSTTKPRGTCPLISSATPITAPSAMAGCPASTASIDPVDIRCPATLIT